MAKAGEPPRTAVVKNIIVNAAIIINIEGIENVHTINTVIMNTMIFEVAGITIMAIGGLGTNGIGMQDSTLKFIDMDDIIARADI